MNERYLAEPRSFERARDVKFLLEKFGPFTGRYLADLPTGWRRQVEAHIADWRDVERAKAMEFLLKAERSKQLVGFPDLTWHEGMTWADNARRKLAPPTPVIDGAVVASDSPLLGAARVTSLDSLSLPPVADESIDASRVDNFVRVTDTLLTISKELYFVDPYLTLHEKRKDYRSVLSEMCRRASPNCDRFVFWALATDTNRHLLLPAVIKADLRWLALDAKLKRGTKLEFHVVEDKGQRDKMHARYLLSAHGGINLDEGFHKQLGARMPVSPVQEQDLAELHRIYVRKAHDMKARPPEVHLVG